MRSYIIRSNLEDIDEWLATDREARLSRHGVAGGDQLNGAQTVISASNVKDLLSSRSDIRMPILLPVDFAIYANELVNKALEDAELLRMDVLEPLGDALDFSSANAHRREGLFWWRIGSQLMWQNVDRRIDE